MVGIVAPWAVGRSCDDVDPQPECECAQGETAGPCPVRGWLDNHRRCEGRTECVRYSIG